MTGAQEGCPADLGYDGGNFIYMDWYPTGTYRTGVGGVVPRIEPNIAGR